MKTRTYKAENMLSAMEKIKQDLGPDAIIVSVRNVLDGPAWQVWKKPVVEVIAMKPDHAKDPVFDSMEIGSRKKKKAKGKKKEEPKEITPVQTEEAHDVDTESSGAQSDDLVKWLMGKINETKDDPGAEKSEQPDKGYIVDISSKKKNGNLSDEALQESILAFLGGNSENDDQLTAIKEEKQKPSTDLVLPQSGEDFVLPQSLNKYYQKLRSDGYKNEKLRSMFMKLKNTLPPAINNNKSGQVKEYLSELLSTSFFVKDAETRLPNTIILAGITGSGKTTLAAKLVIHYLENQSIQPIWISADTYRLGAVSEARAYSESIGIPIHFVYTPEELGAIVTGFNNDHVVIVDTPSYNPMSEESIVNLGKYLSAVPKRSVWFVASASSTFGTIMNAYNALSMFNPSGFVFSKMDEVNNFSSVVNLHWDTGKPIYYFSHSSVVINGLKKSSSASLAKAILNERFDN